MEMGAAVQPMWQGVSLVVDEFTRAAYGEIIVHAVLLSKLRHHAQGAVLDNAAGSAPPRPMETLNCPVEVRESETGPMLHGVLIQEGRAASVQGGSLCTALPGLGE